MWSTPLGTRLANQDLDDPVSGFDRLRDPVRLELHRIHLIFQHIPGAPALKVKSTKAKEINAIKQLYAQNYGLNNNPKGWGEAADNLGVGGAGESVFGVSLINIIRRKP
jgi:hypothetical protein